MIKRTIESVLTARLFSGKAMLILGPRQVGKTTLMKQISSVFQGKSVWLNADNPPDRELLNRISSSRAIELFPQETLVLIDEAQRLENSGLTLKIIHDNCPGIQLIASGSSSFQLTDKIKEALTGRKWTFKLLPISLEELAEHTNTTELNRSVETRIIYGSYPEVINFAGQEKEVLHELISDYLYRDLFSLKEVRKPEILEKLVKALAFQVGYQVSNRELSNLVQVDKETVDRYIRMLEEAFIIFRLNSFSRNLRSELKNSRKIYFYDNGIRNAVINQFNPLSLRNDTGALWENLMISERMKRNEYYRNYTNSFFWRTTRQQEIDYLEEIDGKIFTYEFKWNPSGRIKPVSSFIEAYPASEFMEIHRENYYEFVSGKL
jgi:predicted AAA+ superfamily ATPase